MKLLPAALAGLTLILGSGSVAAQGAGPAGVDALVERYRVAREVPGIAIAVVRNGRVIKARGYGFSNLELRTPVRPETLFGLGSISKQFTATAIMQLVEEGKVGLDDPITRYVDSLPPHWGRVLIRHLLTHTSGLPEEHWRPTFVEFDRHEYAQLDVLRTIFTDSLEFAPGSSWAYRNSAFRLLGMVVERASGESYWTWLDRRIFRPSGMAATRSSDPKTIIPHRAQGYGRERGRIVNRDAVTQTAAFSEGALMSSVLDLARWDSTLYRPRILSEASIARMWTPVALTDGSTRPYGFGWVVGPTNGVRTVSHGGSLPGFVTAINRYIGKGLTVIVLTNSEWADPSGLAQAIAGRYEPELAPRPAAVISDPDREVAAAMKTLVEALTRGELDRAKLTDDAAADLTPPAVDRLARLARPLGAVKQLELLARDSYGEVVRRRYRVRFDRGTLLLTVQSDRSGRLGTIDLVEPWP